MRPRDLIALEFPGLRERLADFASSLSGKEACQRLEPVADRARAEHELSRTWQAYRLLERQGQVPLDAFPDIRAHLRSAAFEGFVLDGEALVEVRVVLAASRLVGSFLRRHSAETPALDDLRTQLRAFPAVEAPLARSLDDDGEMLDQASDELASVRQAIRDMRETVTRRLEELVRRKSMAEIIGGEYVTLRNNRFVVPIRASAASRFSGVVQDRSISGETLFIEPLFAVELNNQLLMAVKEEEAIVRRILADLSALVREQGEEIGAAFGALVTADRLFAAARFARAHGCVQPAFTSGRIELREARHPGLLTSGRAVTPVDLLVPEDRRTLVVTGPNTGGKTVALKTLGLCAVMAQSGLLIPAAEGACLPCFSGIFADVGDEQSIERSLSTFSAHIANLCEIFSGLEENAAGSGQPALVLLDEPGVGTDPEEGAALAVALVRQFESRGARVAITTHYTPVKTFALGHETCMVAAVDFDLETLTPHYRLVYHSLGQSLALPIAERLGLPESVLDAARAARSQAATAWESALERLETSRRQLERQLEELRARSAELSAREESSRLLLEQVHERRRRAWSDELREAREFVRGVKSEGRDLLAELRSASAGRPDLNRFTAMQEQRIAEREAELSGRAKPVPPPDRLSPGDLVELADRGLRGELLSIDGNRAWIQRGSLRFEVPAAQLRACGRPAAAGVQVHVPRQEEPVHREITLIGLRARQAVAELERFLDQAVQADWAEVRIIHGLGSGALRQAVREYLSTSAYCSGYRGGEPAEGGDGVTIATLDR